MDHSVSDAFCFQLSFKNGHSAEEILFNEISGVTWEMEANYKHSNFQCPAPHKYSNLVLKRGVAHKNSEFVTWFAMAVKDYSERSIFPKDIILKLVDWDGTLLKKWQFSNAYPIGWTVVSDKDKVAIECLELSYSSLH